MSALTAAPTTEKYMTSALLSASIHRIERESTSHAKGWRGKKNRSKNKTHEIEEGE